MMKTDSLYDSARPGTAARPCARERLAREGVSSLADGELLSALLGTGTRGKNVSMLADEVLRLIDSSGKLPDTAALRNVAGMGEAKACAVIAALELGRRLFGHREMRVSSPRDLWPLVSHWADRKQERFICCSLNGAHEVIALRVVSVGLVNRTVVHPREVYADPITDRACAVIVAHNHPSGRLEPSPEDREITTRLKEAGDTLGLVLLDHVVFSREGYFSFVEHGMLEPPSPE
jgi:DNA repair protein RadC